MKKILIYRGNGADPFSITSLISALTQEKIQESYSIEYADIDLFQNNKWHESTYLIVFPGGRDIPYHDALKGSPNDSIQDFVLQGGNYLGICAGGYYGCAEVEFEPGGLLEVRAFRELKFFPGTASGPALGHGKFRYQTQEGAEIANLTLSENLSSIPLKAYYNGGCAFINAEKYENVSVIANYTDIDHPLAAIVKCKVGKGCAVLSGVHPEYSANYPFTKKYIKGPQFIALQEIEEERRMVFRAILKHLNLDKP